MCYLSQEAYIWEVSYSKGYFLYQKAFYFILYPYESDTGKMLAAIHRLDANSDTDDHTTNDRDEDYSHGNTDNTANFQEKEE